MRLLLSLLLLLGFPATAAVYTWVDEDGVTHIADDPAALPEHALRAASDSATGGCDSPSSSSAATRIPG